MKNHYEEFCCKRRTTRRSVTAAFGSCEISQDRKREYEIVKNNKIHLKINWMRNGALQGQIERHFFFAIILVLFFFIIVHSFLGLSWINIISYNHTVVIQCDRTRKNNFCRWMRKTAKTSLTAHRHKHTQSALSLIITLFLFKFWIWK